MALKIYGVAQSRAYRALWMAEECGVPYEHVKISTQGGATRTPEFLAVNPNGHIPAIDDNGLKLWESMAINLYLAKKYGKDLAPRTVEEEGQALQWSFWVMTECEKHILQALFHRAMLPPDKRDEKVVAASVEALKAPMQVLEDALKKGNGHLVGGRFTVADLNVASILSWARPARIDFSHVPKAADWLKRCAERPAAREARALQR